MTGQELRIAREKVGLNRTQLAAALGVSERQVYRYEDGSTEIMLHMQLAIAHVLPELDKVRPKTVLISMRRLSKATRKPNTAKKIPA